MAQLPQIPEGIWRPLDASRNEIRLLHVQPAEHLEARVICSLSAHSLDEIQDPSERESRLDDLEPEIDPTAPLHFTALSYACGDIHDTTEITIEGQPYPALTSLVDAIRHVRHDKYGQIMWADQLCINQFDHEERAHQIRLMKDIYSKASTMRVWLGLPENYEYAKKFLCICALEASVGVNSVYDVEYLEPETESDFESEFGFLPGTFMDLKGNGTWDLTRTEESTDSLLRAMEHFISRPWFSRVWTIQEYALAEERTCFHYGTIKTRIWMLQKMIMCIGSFVMNALYVPTGRKRELERWNEMMEMMEDTFSSLGRPLGNSASEAMGNLGQKIGFAGFMSRKWYQRITKSDVVERRLSLFNDRVDDLKLTCYRLQVIHMMAVMFRGNKDDDIRHEYKEDGVDEFGDLPESVRFHNLILATRSRFSTDPRDKIYGLLGLSYEKFIQKMTVDYQISTEEVYKRWAILAMSEVQTPFLLKNAQPHQPSTILPSWVPDLSLAMPGDTSMILNFVEVFYNAWRHGEKSPIQFCNDSVLRARSLFVDTVKHVIDMPNGHPRDLALIYVAKEVGTIYGPSVLLEKSPTYVAQGTFRQAFIQALNVGLEPNIGAEMISGFAYSKRDLDGGSDALPVIFSMNTSSTRLFLTKKGYVGVSFAPDIRKDDKLVLLCDSKLPLVLRSTPASSAMGIEGVQEDNVFRLVASAFVTGLMNGEVFREPPPVHEESKLTRWRRKRVSESDIYEMLRPEIIYTDVFLV